MSSWEFRQSQDDPNLIEARCSGEWFPFRRRGLDDDFDGWLASLQPPKPDKTFKTRWTIRKSRYDAVRQARGSRAAMRIAKRSGKSMY